MVKRIFFMAMIFFSAHGYANCSDRACTNVLIKNIYIKANGNSLVMTSGDESKLSCSGTNGKYLTLSNEDANSEAIYSALLSATIAEKSMQVNIVPGSDGCVIERIEYGKYF